jgi:hypothetical protein
MADSTMITTIFFVLMIPLIYLLISTLHIYYPAGASPSAIDSNRTHDYEAPADLDFLFRVGSLHFYGIRALFMAQVVGGSTLSAAAVAYIAFAHRKTVKVDVVERWRHEKKNVLDAKKGEDEARGRRGRREQWWNRRNTTDTHADSSIARTPMARLRKNRASKGGRRSSILPSFVAFSASPPSTQRNSAAIRLSVARSRCTEVLRPQRRGVQQARQAVSFLRGKTRERTRNMRGLGKLVGMDVKNSGDGSLEASTTALPGEGNLWHDIPSCYHVKHHNTEGRAMNERQNWRASYAIPSYYFKEHDAEGRSIIEPSEKRPSFEIKDMKNGLTRTPEVFVQTIEKDDAVPSTSDNANDVQLAANSTGTDLVSSSLTGSTAVSEGDHGIGKRKSALNHDAKPASTRVRSTGEARRSGDDDDVGWEAVPCSEWRGAGS